LPLPPLLPLADAFRIVAARLPAASAIPPPLIFSMLPAADYSRQPIFAASHAIIITLIFAIGCRHFDAAS